MPVQVDTRTHARREGIPTGGDRATVAAEISVLGFAVGWAMILIGLVLLGLSLTN